MATILSRFVSSCSSIVIGRRLLSATPLTKAAPCLSGNWNLPDISRSGVVSCDSFFRRMASTAGTIEESGSPERKVVPASDAVELETSDDVTSGSVEITQVDTSNSNLVKRGAESGAVEQAEATVKSESEPAASTDDKSQVPVKRVKKVKAALLLSYSGQGYFGMQMQNSGARTIENDLLTAFLAAGVIDQDGYDKPKSTKFQRAARTDKNVSAARNIVSLMVPIDLDVESVNKHLPDQIRVMDYRRVTKGFDAKLQCSSRTYLYMMPTFAFTPLDQNVQESYRITPEIVERVRSTLKLYEGSKNYHNFTSRRKATDPSSHRFIMSFTSSDPFVKDGLEYVVLKVKGQSFMLHQIRKMIGLVVAILRGYANEDCLKKAFSLERIDIPKAPGLGLMLGEAHYDQYNRKFGRDGIHEPLIWDNVGEKIEQFCQDKIYTNVTQTENTEKSMFEWLATVPYHTFDIIDPDRMTKGFGPIGSAHLLVKKLNNEDDGLDMDDDEECEDSDDEDVVAKKKPRRN